MIIKRTSIVSGITRERDINVTQQQIQRWQMGTCIQDAMPHLTADEREFIMTGIIQEEWDKMFSIKNEQ